MLRDIAALVGRRGPTIRVPWYCTLPIAYASEGMARLTGREPLATLEGVRHSKERMFFSSAKAERELGYRPRPYGEALADAIDWFREAGYLDGTRRHRDRGAAGLKLRASSMRIVVRDSQAYVAAEIEILHLSVREWFAGWGGCVPIGNDVNVAGVVGAWSPRLTGPTWDRDLLQWLEECRR